MTKETFEPNGGYQLRNKTGQLVAWFVFRNVEGSPPCIFCIFHPERADNDEQKAELHAGFVLTKDYARESGLGLFDMEEAIKEIRRNLNNLAPKSQRNFEGEIPLIVTNLATCQKVTLTVGLTNIMPLSRRRR